MANCAIPCLDELIYADDAHFTTSDANKRDNIVEFAEPVLSKNDLNVNKGKTELTTLERGKKKDEEWRHVKKVGSLLGDREDITRKKRLARAQMNTLYKVWIQNNKKVGMNTRVKLFNISVKSVLLYNCSTWGLTKSDENHLNCFHRQLLRRLCNVKWPEKSPVKNYIKEQSHTQYAST